MANYPSWTLRSYTQDMPSMNRTVDSKIDSGRVDTFREHYAQYLESVQNQETRPAEIRDEADVRAAQRQNNQSANEARTLLRQLELVRGNIGEDAYQSMRRSLTGSVQAADANNRNLRSVRREMQEQKEAGRRAQEQAQAALQGFQSRYNAFADKTKTQDLPDLKQYQSQETLSNAKENNDYLASLSGELIRQWDSMQGYVDQDTYNEMKDSLTNAQSSIQNNSEVLDSAKAFYGQFEDKADYDWYQYTSDKYFWDYDQLDAEYNRVKETDPQKAEWVKNQRDSKRTSEDVQKKIDENKAKIESLESDINANFSTVKSELHDLGHPLVGEIRSVRRNEEGKIEISYYAKTNLPGEFAIDKTEYFTIELEDDELKKTKALKAYAQGIKAAEEDLKDWENSLKEEQKEEEEYPIIHYSEISDYGKDKLNWSYEEYAIEREKVQALADEKVAAGKDDAEEQNKIRWLNLRMEETQTLEGVQNATDYFQSENEKATETAETLLTEYTQKTTDGTFRHNLLNVSQYDANKEAYVIADKETYQKLSPEEKEWVDQYTNAQNAKFRSYNNQLSQQSGANTLQREQDEKANNNMDFSLIADYTQDKTGWSYSEYEAEQQKINAILQKKLQEGDDTSYERTQLNWLNQQIYGVATPEEALRQADIYAAQSETLKDGFAQAEENAKLEMKTELNKRGYAVGEISSITPNKNGTVDIYYYGKTNKDIQQKMTLQSNEVQDYTLLNDYAELASQKWNADAQAETWAKNAETLKTTVKTREIKERPDFYTITQPQAEKMESDERYNEIAGMYDYWEKTGGTDYHGYASGNMDEMTIDEVRTYIGTYNIYGEEAADEYYDDLSPMLKQRNTQRIQESVSEFMGDMQDIPILGDIANGVATVASVGTSLLSGVYYIEQAIGGALGFDSDVFAFLPAVTSGVRESVMEDYDLTVGGVDVFDLAYGIGTSTLDTLGAVAIGTALAPVTGGASTTIIPATMLGLSAASQTYQDGIARGMGKGQALLGGFVAGALETIFEQIPIGKFLDEGAGVARALSRSGIGKAGFKETAKAFGKSAFLNASEEMLTQTANIAYDTLVNGEYSNYAQAVQGYLSDGLDERQAKSKAMSDMLWQVAQSGISGAAGGVVFGGINQYKVRRNFKALGEAVTEHTGRQIEGRRSAENLLETAKDMEGLSEIYSQTKEAVANNPDSGKTTKLLGRLFYAVEDSVEQDAKSNVHNAAGERLRELGLAKDKAEEGAAILEQVYSGEKLNRKQERFIAGNGQVKQALEEMITAKRHAELLGEQYNPKKAGYRNETGFDNRWYHEALGDLEGKRRALLGVIEPNWEEQMWQSMFSTRQAEQNAKTLQPELQRLGLNADQAGNVANLIAKYIENGSLNPTEVNYLNRNADVRDAFNAIVGENDITGFRWGADAGTTDGGLQQQFGQDATNFDNAQAVITDPATGEVMDSGLDNTNIVKENFVENFSRNDIINGRELSNVKESVDPELNDNFFNREQVADAAETNNPKEINIHGKINSELDEVDIARKIIYEDKSATRLYMDNPDYPQTETQWAHKQIYIKGSNRIKALQQGEFTLSGNDNLPDIYILKEIKNYVFRIDADTPALRLAVQKELNNLKLAFPEYNFSALYGGKK